MTPFLFVFFGAVLVASSLAVILHKNPVTSALFLVLAFCSLAGIYLVFQAEFLGMVQVIVYAGAIMVLFLFVIMYLNLGRDIETGMQILVRRSLGWAIGAVLLIEGVIVIGGRGAVGAAWEAPPAVAGNTQALGMLLYSRYLFPFEITSIVLLVAMVGAVVLTRGRVGPGRAGETGVPAPEAKPQGAPALAPAPSPSPERAPEPTGAGAASGGHA